MESIASIFSLNAYTTLFTKVMCLYWGFFGITLMMYPQLFTQDGLPFVNPTAYWTTLSPETIFAFRMTGGSFLLIALAPKYFRMGVDGFVKMMLVGNFLVFNLFLYYGFYKPLDTAVPMMWKAQGYLCGAVLGWNIVEAVYPYQLKTNFNLFLAFFFGGFGVNLVSAPSLVFGPPSPIAYWNEWGDLADMAARSLGVTILVLVSYGCYLHDSDSFIKQMNMFNLVNLGLFVIPAYFGGDSAVTWIWQAQCVMQVPIVIVNLVLRSALPKPKFDFSLPKPCGLNAQTFMYVNLWFYLPFVLAFATKPNLVFGPSTPGIPMFLEDMNETAVWFGRSWALGIFFMVLGPFAFGMQARLCAKQMLVSYIFTCSLFVYEILTTSIFNLTLVIPMTGINFIFLIWNTIVVYRDARPTTTAGYRAMA
jgi:hypothetical protein